MGVKSPVGDLGRLLDGSAVVVLDSMAGSVRSQVSDYGMDENVNGVARRGKRVFSLSGGDANGFKVVVGRPDVSPTAGT